MRNAPQRKAHELSRDSARLTNKKVSVRSEWIGELQINLLQAQKALQEAELNFKGLADPKANLRKLEQGIRTAEITIAAAGAKLATAASAK